MDLGTRDLDTRSIRSSDLFMHFPRSYASKHNDPELNVDIASDVVRDPTDL